MSAPAIVLTVAAWPKGVDQTQLRAIVEGSGTIAGSGTYATGGLSLPWTNMQDGNFNNGTPFQSNWGPNQKFPVWATAFSKASGFIYAIDPSNGKLRIFESGAGAGTISAPALTMNSYTPAGTNSAPTITTSSGGVTTALGVAAGALSEVTGATGITGVQAPAFTGTPETLTGTVAAPTFTGSGKGPLVELSNGDSVTADTIYFRAEFLKGAF